MLTIPNLRCKNGKHFSHWNRSHNVMNTKVKQILFLVKLNCLYYCIYEVNQYMLRFGQANTLVIDCPCQRDKQRKWDEINILTKVNSSYTSIKQTCINFFFSFYQNTKILAWTILQVYQSNIWYLVYLTIYTNNTPANEIIIYKT